MDMDAYLQTFLHKFKHLEIHLEEITSATNNFDDKNNRIGVGGFGKVYKGEVWSRSRGRTMAAIKRLNSRGGQGIPEFLKEVTMLSNYKHENIVSLLGFCCQGTEMILVYELASRGSLNRHLHSPHLSWAQRLKICLDAAKGLSYLHDPRERHQRVIHCDIKSANILLDDQWNAKVSDFGLSIMGSANEQQSLIVTLAAGTRGYCDPQYAMTHTLTKESDVYSFGVVLFEVLTGRLCCTYSNGVVDKRFVPTWIESYKQKKLNDIVFKNPTISPMDVSALLDESALQIFSDIAYQCLEVYREDRPNMAVVVAELETAFQMQLKFQHLTIQLKEITLATNDFSGQNNCIRVDGFGEVYRGEVSHSKGRSMAAIKRLDSRSKQGIPEFLKEITMLSKYMHENLVSLLGFCCEGSERILVYELASRGSLDHHLISTKLTWTQRLKICLDVAKGISYLHDRQHRRIIHFDMKSDNILLDDQWNAKVSNFELSIMVGSANEQQSLIISTPAAVTPTGYCDPQYAMTHTLTEESDVYSFGVVLFEVLCGRLCCSYKSNGDVEKKFVPTWIESYEHQKLNDIIFKNPTIPPLDESALKIFSNIAYRCLEVDREDRPTMAKVVIELETALGLQKLSSPISYREMVGSAKADLMNDGELIQLLSEGVLVNGGKTWFSINNKGEHCEMRSFVDCLDKSSRFINRLQSEYTNSRFVGGTYYFSKFMTTETRVETQFLSTGITYTVNLVFKYMLPMKKARKGHQYIQLKYRLDGNSHYDEPAYFTYSAFERMDGWWMFELCQFTSEERKVEFCFQLHEHKDDEKFIEVEGIEFWPLEKVDESRSVVDSGENWEEKLPSEYQDMMKWSTSSMQWTTEKEAYSLLRKGFLIDDGKKWFSLDKNGKKCHMLSVLINEFRTFLHGMDGRSSTKSRFGKVHHSVGDLLYMDYTIKSELVSSAEITYAIYLVYGLPYDQSGMKAPFVAEDRSKLNSEDRFWSYYLVGPQTTVLKPKGGKITQNPSNRLYIESLPRKRDDGWMEVQIWKFQTAMTNTPIRINLLLNTHVRELYGSLKGLIIEGVEFRPI